MLLEAWRDFEENYGDQQSLENVQNKMPRRVEKRSSEGDTEPEDE